MLAQPADQTWNLGHRAATKTPTGASRLLLTPPTNPDRHAGTTTETPDPEFILLAWRAGSAAATTEPPEGGDR